MSIKENIDHIQSEISGYSKLIAVSKTFDSEKIREAFSAGVRDFGENYLDEALLKIQELRDLKNLKWHYQGRIQTKKLSKMVGNFDYIHTLASEKHLQKIQLLSKELNIKQNVLLQIKSDEDEREYALTYKNLKSFITFASEYENVNLSGLMFLPPQELTSEKLIQSFKEVKRNFDAYSSICISKGHTWDMISMGMSGDYLDAARNGATHVRVGSKIFGNRK